MSQSLIEHYIEKQSLISAIERFSQKHDFKQIDPATKKYKELLPQKFPGKGEQYAFQVDMDKCTGCKACVTACHNENGLDEGELWRSVGLIQGGRAGQSVLQHVTSACHHCVEPACMSGCPTKAYEKDEVTGIVRHLDDQCFGCQYCILKCPYDVPKYNKKKGIVHKCDMCVNRLTNGQAPACVRACPNGAISIVVVNQNEVKENAKDYVKVADAPDSTYTYPTTKYISNKKFPDNMASADYFSYLPEHSHMPLVIMLVLTQLSVGAYLAEFFLQKFINLQLSQLLLPFHAIVALSVGLIALGASIFHLGRPQFAFRAVLGLKTSWLSREIIVFGLFANLAALYAASLWFVPLKNLLKGEIIDSILPGFVFLSGILGVLCSVYVYRDTRRPFWDNPLTAVKFLLTMCIMGFATVLFSSIIFTVINPAVSLIDVMNSFGKTFCMLHSVLVAVKLFVEGSVFSHLNDKGLTYFKKTALLMTGPLKRITIARFACGVIGGFLMPFFLIQINNMLSAPLLVTIAGLVFMFSLAGEILERYLFFSCAVPLTVTGSKT